MRSFFENVGHFIASFFSKRLVVLFLVVIVLFSSMIGRLYTLQILEAENYQETYINKIQDQITLDATRGNIYDCNNKLLAYNKLTYSVTFTDEGVYTTHRAKNNVALKIVRLLEQFGENVDSDIPIAVNEDGHFEFTTASDAAKNRFIRDLFGTAIIDKMAEEGKDAYALSAKEVFEYLREKYYFSAWKDDDGNIVQVDYATQLKVLAIRYSLTASSYSKRDAVVIASDVSQETVAAMMEHSSYITGLSVAEDNIRAYNDAIYFAHLIGYTGKASPEDLSSLEKEDASYEAGDTVGKAGIESILELELHGQKGHQDIYKDSVGRIIEIIDTVDPVVGNDVYLTVDSDMTKGIYHLLEQMIAGILVNYIVPYDYEPDGSDEKPPIPIKRVYFQLINNNVLDITAFSDENASEVEQEMYRLFKNRRDTVAQVIMKELEDSTPQAYNALSESYRGYMDYVYSNILITNLELLDTAAVDTQDETFISWKSGEISLREFLYHAITMGWINTSAFLDGDLYNNTDEEYRLIAKMIEEEMEDAVSFHKIIYKELIQNEEITGNMLCLALYEQEVFERDEQEITELLTDDSNVPYDLIISKIKSLELTPAQLALDPCSGAVVVTDVKTGAVKAIVSYPSYDNNMMSGTVDPVYWNQLQNDLSTPLLCRATQTTIAPGSTFKMISAIAGLEEGIIQDKSTIDCTGVYMKVSPNPTCWIGEPGHGIINIRGALAQSCNLFFYDIGYMLSTMDGQFDDTKGLALLSKYATLFGLDTISGVEMSERTPTISYEEPVASAIGQGKNSYSTTQLSRYVTALASGKLYDLSVLDSVHDANGDVIKQYVNASSEISLQDSTWESVRSGMHGVTHYADGFVGTVAPHLSACVVDVAGKTGTAQQDKLRSEHAQFVSYAPYDDPEISVTITIPNGYASGNCAYLAAEIYNYIYGEITLDEILSQGAYSIGGNSETSD